MPLHTAVGYIRIAARSLRRSPVIAVVIVLTLGLGIGASSAVFSAVDAVILQPLPFPQSDRLVRLQQVGSDGVGRTLSAPRLRDWEEMSRTFSGISGYVTEDVSEVSGELPERLRRASVAPQFLEVLGSEPAHGRDFIDAETRYGGPGAVLISHSFWQQRFGSGPDALGRALSLGDEVATIVGIMPAGFQFPSPEVDIWTPSPLDRPTIQSRGLRVFQSFGRTHPNVSLDEARQDLERVQSVLAGAYPATDADIRPRLESLKELAIGDARSYLWLLYAAVSLLLLIACTNVAAVLVSRAVQRRSEVALRLSLGASTISAIAQRLVEALILAVLGGALGLLLCLAATWALPRIARDVPRIDEMVVNGRVVLYVLTTALGVTLISGFLPALMSSRGSAREVLSAAARGVVSGGQRTQWVLVGSQVALAVTLLSGAALLARSLVELAAVDPGLDPEQVVTFHVSAAWAETNDMISFTEWSDQTVEGLAQLAAVQSVAISSGLPGLRSASPTEWSIDASASSLTPDIVAESRFVTPGYFEALSIPLISGSLCTTARRGEPPTVMVNQSFVDRYMGGRTTSGARVRPAGADGDGAWSEIVGVVGDARELSLELAPVPTIYACRAVAYPGYFFIARVRDAGTDIPNQIRQRVREIAPQRAAYDVVPLKDSLSDTLSNQRFQAIVVSFFGLAAVLLASVGLYGTLTYVVGNRSREIGVRIALGAEASGVARSFLWQGLQVALLGSVVGLALAISLGGMLEESLYGVTRTDPTSLIVAASLAITIGALAALAPALRAARVDPAQALTDQ